ncbi:Bromodomain [Popillia japonica]|uniref:Bromodomain n=1 Tax=Popillia japonica TaxID=7064 RepID=A0AAW1M2U8_POPJA
MITVTIFTWKVFAILAIFQCLSFNRSSYHNVGAEISSTTDDCRLTPAIRRIKYEGCSSKPIPTFGCTGRCSSYLQVSGSKIWQLIRSCMCCQESGEREASVIIYCVTPTSHDQRFRKFQVPVNNISSDTKEDMPVRRHADPNNVQYIWDSIRSAKHHRHAADFQYITKFLQTETNYTSAQIELYISLTLKDGLIIKQDSKVSKPPSIENYRIPAELPEPYNDGKDWYCIECHLAGDVTACKSCHRVFHAECSRHVRIKQPVYQSIIKHYHITNSTTQYENIANATAASNTHTDSVIDSDALKERELSIVHNFDKQDAKPESDTWKTNFVYDETICNICNLHRLEEVCALGKEELNHLLGFIMSRIRSWLPSNLTHTMAPDQKYEWTEDTDLNWRAKQLFYQYIDMNVMDLKLQSREYSKLTEFIADVLTIQHNVAIFHGIESQEYGAAELMVRDTCHDISELKTCIDCYKHSNEKINGKWFCLPCRVPHKLVWAKQKGYPFWPAKIIKETESAYDVRFFGGKYERSILPKNKKNILPIEIKPKSNEIKKSAAFNKALEELKLHQILLGNPTLLKKYSTANVEKQSPKRPRSTGAIPKTSPKLAKNLAIQQSGNIQQNNTTPHVTQSPKSLSINKKLVKRRTISTTNETMTKSRRLSTNAENRPHIPPKSNVQEVIPISDAEEDEFLTVASYNVKKSGEGCYGQVSSSTEYFVSGDDGFQTPESSDVMHPLEQPYSDAVEKMRRKLEQTKEKKQLITVAMDCMQHEIDRITNDHNDHLKKLYDLHQVQISETKKKQWCYNCEQDAIYHCCWNTAYCSPTCQQQHWQAEHKKVCRRKR